MLWIEVFQVDENGDSSTIETFTIDRLEDAIAMRKANNELHIDIWEADEVCDASCPPEPIAGLDFETGRDKERTNGR